MHTPSLTTCLKLLAILATVAVLGCESADVNPESTATGGGGSDDGSEGGQTPVETIAVTPSETIHDSLGNYTILEVDPIAGYTFTWTLSDPSLGTLSSVTGTRTTYTTSRLPETGSTIQTVTATGRNPQSSVVYRGTSRITHQAP